MSTQPTLPTGPCPRQPDRAGRPAVSARITITDEMIEKGREAREEHYLRVSPVSCTCGWRSDTYIEADGLPRYEAHLVELALEAAAPLIASQALREATDWLAAHDREIRAQALREREQQMRLAEEFAATTGRGLAEWLAVVEALSGPPDTPRAEQTKEDR